MWSLLAGRGALIFDFDGTIAETTPLHALAFKETLAPLGVAVDYPSIAGLKTRDAIVYCLHRGGRCETDFDLQAPIAEKQNRARKLIAEQLETIPTVEAFLVRARPYFRPALVTAGSRNTTTEPGFAAARESGLAVVDARSLNWSGLLADIEKSRMGIDPHAFF